MYNLKSLGTMAKISTVVQTYFNDGTYRNNVIELQIPLDAAKIIEEFWKKQGIHKCVQTKYLATNQEGSVYLKQDEELKCGMSNIYNLKRNENERFEHRFLDEEEDE